MKYEVEVKYRLADPDQLGRRLAEWGASGKPTVVQEDTYFSHPARDFILTNEALRLRRVAGQNHITYKGPRRSGPTKTREEIEIEIASGDDALRSFLRLFEKLGFLAIATIHKRRTPYHLTVRGHTVEVALDHADGLGDFAEIETLAATELELPAAQAAVLSLAEQLGLTEVEPRSYLRMAIDARLRNSVGQLPRSDHANLEAIPSPEGPPQAG
jgi:adenylate cyclase class 2